MLVQIYEADTADCSKYRKCNNVCIYAAESENSIKTGPSHAGRETVTSFSQASLSKRHCIMSVTLFVNY